MMSCITSSHDAGRRSLVCEWIAGKLGRFLGLPIAPFDIVMVPQALIEAPQSGLALGDLGAGPAFGSNYRETMELTASTAAQIEKPLQCDVLAFDWWIRNGDRMLSDQGGNPNLCWDSARAELIVIDHNLAFDPDFDEQAFCDYHIFRGARDSVLADMLQRAHYTERFKNALSNWADMIADIPEQWLYLDPELMDPVSFEIDAFRAILERCRRADFWGAL